MEEKRTNAVSWQLLQELFISQRFAVLATTENGQPYLSLMAFAATDDLRHLLVATYRETRKYRNLESEARVAMLVDNRTNQPSDTQKAIAVTAMGKAHKVGANEKERLLRIYLAKHPHMKEFVCSLECVLIKIRVEKYLMVRHFQDITEVAP